MTQSTLATVFGFIRTNTNFENRSFPSNRSLSYRIEPTTSQSRQLLYEQYFRNPNLRVIYVDGFSCLFFVNDCFPPRSFELNADIRARFKTYETTLLTHLKYEFSSKSRDLLNMPVSARFIRYTSNIAETCTGFRNNQST